MDKKNHSFSKACGAVGGQAAMARELRCSPSWVNQMVSGRRPIPADQCPTIERLTAGAVRCEDLRPDVDWAYLRGTMRSSTSRPTHQPTPEAA